MCVNNFYSLDRLGRGEEVVASENWDTASSIGRHWDCGASKDNSGGQFPMFGVRLKADRATEQYGKIKATPEAGGGQVKIQSVKKFDRYSLMPISGADSG